MPDSDGQERSGTALEEIESDPSSRKRFLKMMGGGVAASSAFGLLLAACGGDEEQTGQGGGQTTAEDTTMSAGSSSGDLEILNYALTLEFLEADFYSKVGDSGLFKGPELALLQTFGEHEQQHVETLTSTIEKLGGTPAQKPETQFPLNDAKSVAELAATVENLGAAAYLGQAGRLKNKELLAAALAIHAVEARHASALNALVGKPYTPDGAFAAPASMDEVLEKVQPFIVS